MMPSTCKRAFSLFLGLLFLSLWSTASLADSAKVKWERIVGALPSLSTDVAGIPGSPTWTVTRGHAMVNLESGQVKFQVEGLTISRTVAPPFSVVIGTPGNVASVMGTFVCNAKGPGGAVLVNTPGVPLSAEGDADFQGHLDLDPACTGEPQDIAFLIRVAGVIEGGPPVLIGAWIAHGAVRRL